MQLQNATLTGGEDRTLSLVARTHTGALLNLTGASLTFNLARNAGDDALVQKTSPSQITITSAVNGAYDVALSDTDTAALQVGDYLFQVMAIISGITTHCTSGVIRVSDNIGPPSS